MATVLVTGANRGIGLSLCEQFVRRGDKVIAVCRHASAELDQLGVRIERGIDVSSDDDVKDLAGRLKGTPIDLLILNAGILRSDDLTDLDLASVREQIEVNAIGPLRVTSALLGNLSSGAKLALMTSRMGSIGDNGSGGYYGYRMSKAALNAAGMSLARDLAPRKIAVAILHPGYVKTDMTGGEGGIEPAEAARMLIARIDALTMETTGTFWHANGQVLPW